MQIPRDTFSRITHNAIMDIHNWIMDIHDSIVYIHDNLSIVDINN